MAKLTLVFALVAAITVVIAITLVSYIWSLYFNEYTAQNIQTLAQNTANRIALLSDDEGALTSYTVYPAEQSALVSPNVGVKVLDANGNTVYDSATDPIVLKDAEESGMSYDMNQPSNPEQIALANIIVDRKVIGSVRVWVYGGDALMNKLDLRFRDNSLKALVMAGVGSVVIASVLGVFFSRRLMSPIERLAYTASLVKEGDFSARASIKGSNEIAQLGETFDDMVAAIEKDRQLEQRLVSDVAHELRTPLMGIQSTVEAMIDGVYEADDEHLQLVNVEVKRLSRLVDALLKLSRLEARSQQMREEPINLSSLAHDIALTHQLFVTDSGLTLDCVTEPDIMVLGDSDMLRQAIVNLISNAVRYTPEGGRVELGVRNNDGYAEITVADTGIGISQDDLKMVFSRFWRADAGRARASGGLGIGLAIVNEIVDRHDGAVTVESEVGVGTVFVIKIPLYIKSEKPASKTSGNPRARWLSGRNDEESVSGGGGAKRW